MFVCLYVCLYLSICPSLSFWTSFSLFLCHSIHPPIHQFIYPSLPLDTHTHPQTLHISISTHTHHRHIDPHPESLPFHFHLTKRGQPRGQKPDNLIYFQVFQLVIRWLIQTPLKTFYYVSETKVAGSFFLEVLLFLASDHKQKQTPML